MKRGAPAHPKVHTLAALLNIPRYSAVGILESLWHFAQQYAQAGDVGRHADEAIARAIGWEDDAATLVSALVAAGWLDRCACHRARVHDWKEHADQTVKRYLSERNQHFLSCYDDASTVLAPSQPAVAVAVAVPKPIPKPSLAVAAERPTVHPLIGDRRPELELEWLRLVREISAITGEPPEDIPPLWDGRRKLDPAKLSPERLLRDVQDLRARRLAIEKPGVRQLAAQPGPDQWTERAGELAGEFVQWRAGQDQTEHRAAALGRWFDLKGIPREPFPTTAWVAVSDRLKERDRKAAS